MQILDSVLGIAKDTPPVDNKLSRFGNPAFKTFYDTVSEVRRTVLLLKSIPHTIQASASLHRRIPDLDPDAVPELEVYFKESWGNKQRVDYGSGMELNFVCWLWVVSL